MTIAAGGYRTTGGNFGQPLTNIPVLELWDGVAGRKPVLAAVDPISQIVTSIFWSPDGLILFAGTYSSIQVFNSAGYGLLNEYPIDIEGFIPIVISLAVSPDRSEIVYDTPDGRIFAATN